MKKVLIILAVLLLAFTCEKEGDIELSNANLAGIWNVTKITMDGETTELPPGMIMVELKSDGKYYVDFFDDRYVGSYTVEGSTVTGVSGSIIEYFEFTSFSGNKAKIDYRNSEGEIYKFEAVKS